MSVNSANNAEANCFIHSKKDVIQGLLNKIDFRLIPDKKGILQGIITPTQKRNHFSNATKRYQLMYT